MIKPTPEQFGLTESLLVSLEKERDNYNALKWRRDRLVKLAIAAGVISAIALYIGYGFDWPLFIPMLLIGAVFMGYLSPMVTEAIVNRLDPHSRIHKQYGNYWIECLIYRAFWSGEYWDAFWKALNKGGPWKESLPESPHSRLQCLPDPGEELFLILAGERYVLAMPRPSEPVNREFADRLLKTVKLSSAQKGIICSDENIPQEVRRMAKSGSIAILTSRLFLTSRVLRLAILQATLPVLESATGPVGPLYQYCAKFRESKLPFPQSMIRQAIAEELQECYDKTLQTLLEKLYLILENFLPDKQVVQYDKLREFGEETFQAFRDMQEEGKPALEILKTLIPLVEHLEEVIHKMDHTIDTNLLERMKKRSEEIEVFKEIAAKNVKSENC